MSTQISQLNDVLSDLKIKGSCVDYQQHRHLAFYDVVLDSGSTVRRIELRTREIALHLKTQTAPIVQVLPKQGCVRLRVALHEAEPLPLSSIYKVEDAPADFQLPVLFGESDEGRRLWVDLARHPHTLVAGATGSGKSVFLSTLIANMVELQRSKARKVELFLVDPKRVEFNRFEHSLDRLLTSVAYTYDSTLTMLDYLHSIMEGRYEALAKLKVPSVEHVPGVFSSIVVIIDEVADLMMQDKRAGVFQSMIVKLAQKCRAAGIYLVMATQRPSTDVLTGIIKANFPARVSFKVGQRVDSQVILDAPGAEALLGRGDAILQSPVCDRVRFQSTYVDADEIVARS